MRRRRRRLQIGDATAHILQGDEVQISALKEYVPCGHVRFMCLSSFFPPPHPNLQNAIAVPQKAV